MFRDRAVEAFEQAKAEMAVEDEAYKLQRAEAARSWFVSQFGMEPDQVDGNHVHIDEVVLIYCDYVRYDQRTRAWRVLGKCSTCGEEALSEEVESLAAIGRILTNFVPSHGHTCEDAQELSPRGRMIRALERCADALNAQAAAMY